MNPPEASICKSVHLQELWVNGAGIASRRDVDIESVAKTPRSRLIHKPPRVNQGPTKMIAVSVLSAFIGGCRGLRVRSGCACVRGLGGSRRAVSWVTGGREGTCGDTWGARKTSLLFIGSLFPKQRCDRFQNVRVNPRLRSATRGGASLDKYPLSPPRAEPKFLVGRSWIRPWPERRSFPSIRCRSCGPPPSSASSPQSERRCAWPPRGSALRFPSSPGSRRARRGSSPRIA